MKFCHSTVYTKDLDKCIKFYEEVMGVKLIRRFAPDDTKEIAFMDAGTIQLEFIQYNNGDTPAIDNQPTWAFEADDFDAMLKFIEESDEYRVDNYQEVAGARFFFFYDINNVYVQIIEHK